MTEQPAQDYLVDSGYATAFSGLPWRGGAGHHFV